MIMENDSAADIASNSKTDVMFRGRLFSHMVSVSAPVSTYCSYWSNGAIASDPELWTSFSTLCGPGSGKDDLAAWVEKVWAAMRSAKDSVEESLASKEGSDTVLRVYLGPEWLFRRYSEDGKPKPFSPLELKHVLQTLEIRMRHDTSWENWLVVPGTVYWGFDRLDEIAHFVRGKTVAGMLMGFAAKLFGTWDASQFAVFNTVPIFAGGSLVAVYNKRDESDNMLLGQDFWGKTVLNGFGGVAAGAEHVLDFFSQEGEMDAADALKTYGLNFGSPLVVFGGRLIGVDVCIDHDSNPASKLLETFNIGSRDVKKKFDLQLLLSSGKDFKSVEEGRGHLNLRLEQGGMALRCDGSKKGVRLMRATADVSMDEHMSSSHFEDVEGTWAGSWGLNARRGKWNNASSSVCNSEEPKTAAPINCGLRDVCALCAASHASQKICNFAKVLEMGNFDRFMQYPMEPLPQHVHANFRDASGTQRCLDPHTDPDDGYLCMVGPAPDLLPNIPLHSHATQCPYARSL